MGRNVGRHPQIKICNGCGTSFTQNSNAQKFCNYKCGDKGRSKKYRDSHVDELRHRRCLQWAVDQEYKRRILARRKMWGQKNRARLRRYNFLYRRSDPAHFRQYARDRYRQDKTEALAKEAKRRAAKFIRTPLDTQLTKPEWDLILFVCDYRCVYCGVPQGGDIRLTQDHVAPLSKGGHHTADNVVPACRRCNSRKHARSVEEFYADIERGSYD